MPSSLTSGSISPGSSRVPTPTANDFPTPQGQIFTVTKRDRGLVSPVESSFSFRDEDSPIHALSASDLIDDRTMARPLVRGTPGDSALALDADDDIQQTDVRRKKSQYYTEVFAYREPNLSPRERICKDSVITAEVKTNVIVRFALHPPLHWS